MKTTEIKFLGSLNESQSDSLVLIIPSKDKGVRECILKLCADINMSDVNLPSENQLQRFLTKENSNTTCYVKYKDSKGKEGEKSLHIFAVKKISDLKKDDLIKLGGTILSSFEGISIGSISVFTGLAADKTACIAAGALIRSFKCEVYKTKKKDKKEYTALVEFVLKNQKDADKTLNYFDTGVEGYALASSVNLAREFVFEPPNVLYPESYANRIKEQMPNGVEVQILDKKQIEALGMGALLGVSQGSNFDPRVVIMKWSGGKPSEDPIVFIGKGVTFDTGGISLKPSRKMWDMKYDMAGSACVVGTVKCLAERNAKCNFIGIVGLVENAVDGNAQRPSDVIKSMSGQYIEVLNTDAEGRLVLADLLWYAQKKLKPKFMVNVATLTGAIVVALGEQAAGLFSNDKKLISDLEQAGVDSGELLHNMPMYDAYDKDIDSSIADMQNISIKGYGADSITAAKFLQRFVEDGMPWAHLDIAGMAWSSSNSELYPAGPTGFGVRLMNQLASKFEKK